MSKNKEKEINKRNLSSPIYNYPIVPEEAERHKKNAKTPPLTRGELKTDFRSIMQFCNNWKEPIYRQVFCELKLASVTNFPWYLCVEEEKKTGQDMSKRQFTPRADWEKHAEDYGKSGIYFYSNSMASTKIPKEVFEKLRNYFGERFIGFNEGEWDGAYIVMISKGNIRLSPERTRKEACQHYIDWLQKTYETHQNYMMSMSSLGLGCHYAGELGARMLGFESGQILPCDTVRMAFCRGACKQYDLLMNVCPSVFSWKGASCFKCYPKHGQKQSLLINSHYPAGPEHGASIGLLKRLWWLAYMNGASILGLECGYLPTDASSENEAQSSVAFDDPVTDRKIFSELTPIGWLHWEASHTAKKHPMRGVPYVPIAVMLPFEHGWHAQPCNEHPAWYPQPYLHDFENEKNYFVWGNIPYNDGDWQIDKFFRWVFPGSNLAHSCATRDERGIITGSPFGDSFDVILNNADDTAIAKYQAIVLLGSQNINSDDTQQKRLEKFVNNGGLVITDTSQWDKLPTKAKELNRSKLIKTFQYGKGQIILVQVPFWGSGANDESTLTKIRAELEGVMRSYNLIKIKGRPVYSLVNVTDKPDELIITLCNPSQSLPWEGQIKVKGTDIVHCEEWLGLNEIGIKDGTLRCGVPANDIRVFRIRTEEPFLDLKFERVPWRELGYGAPEWEEKVDARFYDSSILRQTVKGNKNE